MSCWAYKRPDFGKKSQSRSDSQTDNSPLPSSLGDERWDLGSDKKGMRARELGQIGKWRSVRPTRGSMSITPG